MIIINILYINKYIIYLYFIKRRERKNFFCKIFLLKMKNYFFEKKSDTKNEFTHSVPCRIQNTI